MLKRLRPVFDHASCQSPVCGINNHKEAGPAIEYDTSAAPHQATSTLTPSVSSPRRRRSRDLGLCARGLCLCPGPTTPRPTPRWQPKQVQHSWVGGRSCSRCSLFYYVGAILHMINRVLLALMPHAERGASGGTEACLARDSVEARDELPPPALAARRWRRHPGRRGLAGRP